eukprot:GAHX01002048.1.p1 GENE.GAHX01002048.1~~GAHX01002048.1.p1  ORF type:complete len:476 (-),score=92.88 GAHX01002048.1:24-1451(-)
MAKQLITIQVGQCGNQIGAEFLHRASREHGLLQLQQTLATAQVPKVSRLYKDDKEVLFYESEEGSYVSRSIFIDSEPRVISQLNNSPISNFINPNNIVMPTNGLGAGNNWACGNYIAASSDAEKIFDVIDKEKENADQLEGIVLLHSVSGGTGSGAGSHLLAKLKEDEPSLPIMAVSVLPNTGDKVINDVVVHPYNAILTISRLNQYTDAFIAIDNGSLQKKANSLLTTSRKKNKASEVNAVSPFEKVNKQIANIVSSISFNSRFPGYFGTNANYNLKGLINSTVVIPNCNLLSVNQSRGCLPTTRSAKNQISSVVSKLVDQIGFSYPIDFKDGITHSALTMINIANKQFVDNKLGNLAEDVYESRERIRKNKNIKFFDWIPTGLRTTINTTSPYLEGENHTGGFMYINNSSCVKALEKTLNDFDKLKKKKAFLSEFKKVDLDIDIMGEMEDAREVVFDMIDEYKNTEQEDYLNL